MTEKEDWGDIDPEQQKTAQTNTSGVTWWAVEDSNGNPVQIELAERGKEYVCPECKGCMIPVKGEQRAHHFRHKSSTSSDGNGCGGEGPRHYRVKTMLAIMLRQIEREAMRWETKIELERRVGNDQPDILVSIGPQKLLGIEIVDSNPPSDEKRERWGNQLHEVWISDWDDRTIGNALLLSGKLIPTIIAFKAMTEEITTQISSHRRAVEAVKKYHEAELEELQSTHERQVSAMHVSMDEEFHSEKKKKTEALYAKRAQDELAQMYVGKWQFLRPKQQIRPKEWAVRTDMNAEPGDQVIVLREEGDSIQLVTVIKHMTEFRTNYENRTAVYRVTKGSRAYAVEKAVTRIAAEKAASEKEKERQRRRRISLHGKDRD